MMNEYLTSEIIEGVHFCEPDGSIETDRKIGLLAAMGCIAVEDVDLTMTINGAGEDLTSFGILSKLLPPKLKRIDDDLYSLFEDKIRDDTIEFDEAVFWWQTTLTLYKMGKITAGMVRSSGGEMRPRPEVSELARAYREEDIPTAWITAGVSDVCEAFATKHDIMPDVLIGNRLRYGRDGLIRGWVPNTLTHPLNKNEMSHRQISELRQPHSFHGTYRYPGTILLGDGSKDPQMVRGKDVLRISVANPHGPNDDAFFEKQRRAGYDLVLHESGLHVATAIARRIGEVRRDLKGSDSDIISQPVPSPLHK